VKDFIQVQIEASERLFKVMLEDHKERMAHAALWGDMNAGLIRKLEERDEEISRLRAQVEALKGQK